MTDSGMELGSASLLDATMMSARSRSGRRWRVHKFDASNDEYTLVPLGDDVRAAQDRHGRMQGGVRDIRVAYEDLHNDDKWRRVLTDLERTEQLRPGDACEFHYPARRQWLDGTVVHNGGSGFWDVRDNTDREGHRGQVCRALYIEHVRAPGTDPWGR